MTVKSMLSWVSTANCIELVGYFYLCPLLSNTFRQKRLDKISGSVVIIFTAVTQPNRENKNAAGENPPRQAEDVTRNTQPPPARGASSSVSGQRLLRSQRLGAGEIRDATTGPSGQAGGFPHGQGVWFLPPVVLPSRICLRARRFARITSPEAWSEERSQAHSGSDGVRREQRTVAPSLSFAQLAELVQHHFHVKVHPRSIERQLLREKKLQ